MAKNVKKNLSKNMVIRNRYKHRDIIEINLRPFLNLFGYGQYLLNNDHFKCKIGS